MNEYLAPARQWEIFPADIFGNRQVTIIGAGGEGSNVAWIATLQGVPDVHVYDGDILDIHNIHNQRYPRTEVTNPKVEALAREIHRWTGVRIQTHREFVTGPLPLKDIVFLCVDNNDTRWNIYESCIMNNHDVYLMCDLRMDATYSILYTINPRIEQQRLTWEWFWKPQSASQNQTAACGGPLSCAVTSNRIANTAVEQLIRWFRREREHKEGIDSKIRVPFSITYNLWTCEQDVVHYW